MRLTLALICLLFSNVILASVTINPIGDNKNYLHVYSNTLPIVVFSKVRLGLSPEVNALSAILMLALLLIGIIYFYFNKKFKH